MTYNTRQATVLSSNPYLELNNKGEVKILELTGEHHRLGRAGDRVDLIVPNSWLVVSSYHATLRREGDNYRIYDGDGKRSSTNGLFVKLARITPNEGYLLQNGTEIKIGLDPNNQILVKYVNPNESVEPASMPALESISLKDRSVLLGRDRTATLQLDSPVVSRRHATIEPDGKGNYILGDRSTNGVFVNGKRVNNSVTLQDNAKIRIGPFILVRRGDKLEIFDRGNQVRLDSDRLVRIVKYKETQRPLQKHQFWNCVTKVLEPFLGNFKDKTLLNDISFPVEPGQFVALVGGSGAGKSTLMRTLLGIDPTTKGKVYVNGDDLRTNFNMYRTQIGYVPQDDIIHRDLTVAEVLTYSAQLRLPPDIDINGVVETTLEQIEMSDRRDVLVKNLSGGQRKRVSIGVELLADPKLFFLDEPTSGLDPGLDGKMMQLLRKLADRGRTIILVTHATANIKTCDRIAFLGKGGRLCYFGPPLEALDFFDVKSGNFADIYNELETEEAEVHEWMMKFRQSSYYQHYVGDRLSVTTAAPPTPTAPPQKKTIAFWKQLTILTQRYLKLTLRDPINLGLALFTAPISISLILFAVQDKDPLIGEPEATLAPLALRVLFVFTCACLWVGLSSSLQEIVKETAIYTRERLVNLGLFSYLGSKAVVLFGLGVLQTLLITAVILIGFKHPEPELIPWFLGATITTFLTLISCISFGLAISAMVKNSSQANSALPLILLPQIIFSGVLFKMEGLAGKFSWVMLSRWSVGAYGSLVNVNSMVPEAMKLPDGSTVPLPFEGSDVYNANWENLSLNWGVLCLHSLIYLGLTLWLQKRKDIL